MTTAYDLENELNAMANDELKNDAPPPPPRPQTQPRPVAATTSPALVMDDKNVATLTHIGTIAAAVFSGGFLDIIVPAVAYVAFRDKSEFLRGHLRSQLNFQLTSLIVAVAAIVFSIVTAGFGLILAVPLLAFFFLVDIVCSIKAATAASRGESYEFPLSLNLIS